MYRKRLFLAGAIFLALSAGFKANAADLTPQEKQEKKAVRFYAQGEDKESKGDKRFLELYEKSAKRGYIPASIKVKTLTLESLETEFAKIKGQLKTEEDPSQLHSGAAGNLQKVIKLKEHLDQLSEWWGDLNQEIQDLQARSNTGIRFSYGVDYCMNNGISMFSDDEDAVVQVPTVQEPAVQLPDASADLVESLNDRAADLKKDSESLKRISGSVTTPAIRNCLTHISTTVIPGYLRLLSRTSKKLQESPGSYNRPAA